MSPAFAPRLIWQIFRKDVKLLWPLALAVMVCAVALIVLTEGQDASGPDTQIAIALLRPAFVIGSALLILLAVQQEPLAGVGQDWLARPIRRSHLLCAKLLFVLLMIHVPLVLAGLAQGVWEGFPPGSSLASAAARNVAALLLLSLPILALGALTRNLIQAIVGSLVVAIGYVVVLIVVYLILLRIMDVPRIGITAPGSGVSWVWETLSLAVLQVTVAAVLALLYAKRTVLTARVVFCAGLAACAGLVLFMPFGPAFALQIWLSAPPSGHSEVSVAFDPASELSQQHVAGVSIVSSFEPDTVNLVVPLSYAGVPQGSVMNVEYSQIRILDQGGKTLLLRPGANYSSYGLLQSSLPAITAGRALRQEYLLMPGGLYRQFSDRPVRLEIEQFMTLLRLRTVAALPAAGGDERVAGVGRCTTRLVDRIGTGVEATCRATGELPPCMSIMLALPDGAHNPDWMQCSLNYAPWRTHPGLGALSQVASARLPFTDPIGQRRYPVSAAQLLDAHVAVIVYEPVAHFVRYVEVPQILLRDLVVLASLPPPQRQGR